MDCPYIESGELKYGKERSWPDPARNTCLRLFDIKASRNAMVRFSQDLKYRVCLSCDLSTREIILSGMLKRITLHNFMSHSHTVIDLSPGLTVLTGPNNCGKSAFVSALQILADNTSGDFMVRHGEKECRVIVETDDGHTIEWKRKKKTVSYNIDGVDFHRLRNSVPDQLHEILKLSKVKAGDADEFDVHFGEQKSPIFLLGDRGSRAARFFASSSDASVLIEMQKLHRSKVKAAQQEYQRQQNELKQAEIALELLKPIPDLENKLELLNLSYESLQKEQQQIRNLEVFIQEFQQSEKRVSRLSDTVTTLNILPESLQQENEQPLAILTQRYVAIEYKTRVKQLQISALQTLTVPPSLQETDQLEKMIREMFSLEQVVKSASATGDCLKQLSEPPHLAETEPLQKIIQKLALSEELTRIDRQESRVLESCLPPPELTNLQKMEQLCQQWEQAAVQFNAQRSLHEKCESEYESVRSQLLKWVEENPSCPTCGAELEPDQFIRTAETGLQGHSHGT
ncbi:AAA family ATPase [Gimesia sp.]|uniref:AAA family ATPase n=1 Tax=Gimesia sp. TaxID=2024833 RepID=UPI003A8C9002